MKDILAVVGFPKATYMYWRKRFDRENPDKQLEDEITKIHIENKDYGYRRVYRELRNRKIFVNKKKGRKKTLDIRECKKPSKYDGEKPVDTSAEHVKELEDELLKLRIENAYLKELRRLRLEEETLLKKRRESSTVSEDSST